MTPHMKRWITGIIAIPILFGIIAYGGKEAFAVLIIVASLAGMQEYNRMAFGQGLSLEMMETLIIALLILLVLLILHLLDLLDYDTIAANPTVFTGVSDPSILAKRIANLIQVWNIQIIEVLGASGFKDIKKTVGDRCKIKAAADIRNIEDALAVIEAGATRIGENSAVEIP